MWRALRLAGVKVMGMPGVPVLGVGFFLTLPLVRRLIGQTQDVMEGSYRKLGLVKSFGPGRRFTSGPAFTLIELLVVIAIIVILAALLLPALSRAKQASMSAACRAHLHQWGVALKMYVDDYGAYPPWQDAPLNWDGRLAQYLRAAPLSTNDFNGPVVGPSKTWVPECPAFMRLPGVLIGFGVTASFAYNSIGCSLPDNWPGNNLGLGGPVWNGFSRRTRVRETDVVRPSNTLALGDAVPWQDGGLGPQSIPQALPYYFSWSTLYPIGTLDGFAADLVGPYPNAPNAWARAAIQRRHGGRWNVLFCDQHIDNLTTKGLFDVSQDSIAQRWNIDQLPHNH